MLTATEHVSGSDAIAVARALARPFMVYVDSSWVHRLPPMSYMERGHARLAPLKPNSRLSCQIVQRRLDCSSSSCAHTSAERIAPMKL